MSTFGAKDLLAELNETTDGRRRGEIRRHYNTVCKNIACNNDVLNALMDKKVGVPKKASKPKKNTKKATSKGSESKDKPRPTPEQVKEAAGQSRTRTTSTGRRAKLEKLSFLSSSNGLRSEASKPTVRKKQSFNESSTLEVR